MSDVPLNPGGETFPNHVYDALGGGMHLLEKRIGGSILVAEKRPAGGPITLITAGVNRLPVDRGLPVELADGSDRGPAGRRSDRAADCVRRRRWQPPDPSDGSALAQ